MTRLRLDSNDRKARILEVALKLAEKEGYQNIRRNKIAELAGVCYTLINWHFKSISNLKNTVMKEAVERQILPIIAQGLLLKNPEAMNAPEDVKQKVINQII
jgi:AcrR family transcriptional regulator